MPLEHVKAVICSSKLDQCPYKRLLLQKLRAAPAPNRTLLQHVKAVCVVLMPLRTQVERCHLSLLAQMVLRVIGGRCLACCT